MNIRIIGTPCRINHIHSVYQYRFSIHCENWEKIALMQESVAGTLSIADSVTFFLKHFLDCSLQRLELMFTHPEYLLCINVKIVM